MVGSESLKETPCLEKTDLEDECVDEILGVVGNISDIRHPVAHSLVLVLLGIGVAQKATHPFKLVLKALDFFANISRKFDLIDQIAKPL
uniref:Disease resistance family protein n=1 Tax=Rhizophora mucronata TaxID=61149 RepID=A0A2P2IP92_RHIMU